ncbi:MAG: DUF2807 domain-containing protein [Flavobacteriaceae bacterium]|nr:DUF2807 domain-containing protein [Flavobacteriaceae bacterium]
MRIRYQTYKTYRWLVLVAVFWLASCSTENAPDCFQTSGDLISEEIPVSVFNSITVFENIELILSSGPEQSVQVVTGENLRNEITAEVVDDRLILRNENGCNFLRSYGKTKFYVTTPALEEIRSSTGSPIRSEGILTVDELRLISESFNNPEAETTDGSFELDVNATKIAIVANGIAYFAINGVTEEFAITVAAGDSRIEANGLVADRISLNHRGTNDILIRPQSSLSGVIRGTGDVISYNRPDSVDIAILYKGKLIFKD